MIFKPHRSRIEIIPEKKPEGPLLDTMDEYRAKGTVVSVGRDVEDYKPGDIVLFRDFAMIESAEHEGKTVFTIPDSDEVILGAYVAEEPV